MHIYIYKIKRIGRNSLREIHLVRSEKQIELPRLGVHRQAAHEQGAHLKQERKRTIIELINLIGWCKGKEQQSRNTETETRIDKQRERERGRKDEQGGVYSDLETRKPTFSI